MQRGGRARPNNHKGWEPSSLGWNVICWTQEEAGIEPDRCVYSLGSFCLPGREKPSAAKAYFAWYITFIRGQAVKKRHGFKLEQHIKEQTLKTCCRGGGIHWLQTENIILYSVFSFVLLSNISLLFMDLFVSFGYPDCFFFLFFNVLDRL